MDYLHTMVRVSNLDASLDFYCNKLGMIETRGLVSLVQATDALLKADRKSVV